MRIAIIGRHGSSNSLQISKSIYTLANVLQSHGHEVYSDENTVSNLIGHKKLLSRDPLKLIGNRNVKSLEVLSQCVDIAVVLGGDGTMLDVARKFSPSDRRLPLIGVNHGRLGFITDIASDVAVEEVVKLIGPHLARFVMGSATPEELKQNGIEEKILLQADVVGGPSKGIALNEVIVIRDGGSFLEFSVMIDGVYAYSARADGVMIATPTGSTAYSLAAGGSILSPNSGVVQILPMMPQTLSYRPLIISDECKIDIILAPDPAKRAKVICDGNEYYLNNREKQITIYKARQRATFLHPASYDYFHVLREKLYWHLQPGTRPYSASGQLPSTTLADGEVDETSSQDQGDPTEMILRD